MSDPTRYTQIPNGCWVACIAGLTGIPHEDLSALVPDSPEGDFVGTNYHNAVNQLTRSRGWRQAYLGPDMPKGFAIAGGKSPRGFQHAVIVLDGELWHDPHPDGGGLVTTDSYEVWVPLIHSPAMQQTNTPFVARRASEERRTRLNRRRSQASRTYSARCRAYADGQRRGKG